MKKKRFYTLLLSLVSFCFSACVQYKDVEIIGLEDVNVREFNMKGILVDIDLKVSNPNTYNISIINTDLDLFVNGSKMGKAVLKDKVTFIKKSQQVYKIRVGSNFKDMEGSVLGSLFGILMSKNINFRIKGNIKAKALMISKKIDVDFQDKVSL